MAKNRPACSTVPPVIRGIIFRLFPFQRLLVRHKCPNLPGQTLLQTAADMITQFENGFVGDVVDDIWPFLAASQNASARQRLQMPRNIGLGEPRRLHEPGYVLLPLFQRQNQFQAARFAQDPKPRRNELKRLRRHALKLCLTPHRGRMTAFHIVLTICVYAHIVNHNQ